MAEQLDADLLLRFGRGEVWIGAAPPEGVSLAKLGFTVLVLCAHEYQPREDTFPGLLLIYAPFNDSGRAPSKGELDVAMGASRHVSRFVREGHKVLVTCWQGRNRSGLVAALALMRLTGMRGDEAATRVILAREGALQNDYFLAFLADRTTRRAVARKA